MQFHHHGYVSGDPRVKPAAGVGLDRPDELPDEIDVLIVGSGPAGMIAAAQLAQFPGVVTRMVERRPGRLVIGQADGIQARSVETFQAFGFAERIIAEAYRITEMNFWAPDADDPTRIARASRVDDDPHGISEFPHLVVNQARVLDYFAEVAARAPARVTPDFGIEFVGLEVADEGDHPVTVTVRDVAGRFAGRERTVRAKYVVGCDGARSRVREAIGRKHIGGQSMHAWGVMDVLAVTDFPDVRIKCAIQSAAGSILHIPREGGYLGGFNWSSQHLVIPEVSGGATAASGRQGDSSEVEVAGSSEVPASCRGRVLGADREGVAGRGSRGRDWRGAGGRRAVVPQRWRHAAVRSEVQAHGSLLGLHRA